MTEVAAREVKDQEEYEETGENDASEQVHPARAACCSRTGRCHSRECGRRERPPLLVQLAPSVGGPRIADHLNNRCRRRAPRGTGVPLTLIIYAYLRLGEDISCRSFSMSGGFTR
jgi:hypothetical protein